ncbi:alpha/beta fold hydrolase [Algivirga pacifica]|uniref:Alpha/beta fold hydrolase n=1 Tax=Algivirga pacifica TaxID=1162670 RepID=A0ABP9D549_9BACT
MELHYRRTGEGSPLIILHGLFGSSDNWMSIGKTLAEKHELFLVDQRNHGLSPNTEAFNYTTFVEDLYQFIDYHNIENPTLLGHSMGGKVAMQFAAQHPELLKQLIVVDIAPRAYPVHHQTILEGMNAIPVASLKGRNEADKILSEYIPEMGIRMFLLKNLQRNPEGGFSWKINLPVITKKIAEVGKALDHQGTIDIPSLFIGGKNSNYIQSDDEAMIRDIFTDVRIEMIDQAGHWVHAEQPQKVTDHILSFTY